ncbi:hypothetical protein BRADI_5g09256v3 [Brachypodium distachyon]|uniref:Uncharacterized protein n=1 Tax=Brachypodium distachyon TaxID=15368 RepID=A0A2K2CG63_BRADI|nr:hypothetical protein BRADI_5g09256v3 [Brachypodium distachyon]
MHGRKETIRAMMRAARLKWWLMMRLGCPGGLPSRDGWPHFYFLSFYSMTMSSRVQMCSCTCTKRITSFRRAFGGIAPLLVKIVFAIEKLHVF